MRSYIWKLCVSRVLSFAEYVFTMSSIYQSYWYVRSAYMDRKASDIIYSYVFSQSVMLFIGWILIIVVWRCAFHFNSRFFYVNYKKMKKTLWKIYSDNVEQYIEFPFFILQKIFYLCFETGMRNKINELKNRQNYWITVKRTNFEFSEHEIH